MGHYNSWKEEEEDGVGHYNSLKEEEEDGEGHYNSLKEEEEKGVGHYNSLKLYCVKHRPKAAIIQTNMNEWVEVHCMLLK